MKRKKILLLGGGHANIQVLHALGKLHSEQVEVTLISDVALSPYSGMIPSFLAGIYSSKQLHFDLKKICSRFKCHFVEDSVTSIQAELQDVKTAQGLSFSFDLCSINIGIQPREIPTDLLAGNLDQSHPPPEIIYLKPISKLIEKWQAIVSQHSSAKQALIFTVIGGGAGAFEIAVACRRHFRARHFQIRLIAGYQGLLPEHNLKTRKKARESLQQLEIELLEGQRVERIQDSQLQMTDGSWLKSEILFVATSAAAPALFQNSDLPLDSQGFVQVGDDLRVPGFSNVFAAGDCCEFTPHPLPKAGVFAVRQGAILAHNLSTLIEGRQTLRAYHPQSDFLSLLVSGDNRAIGSYGRWSFEGRLAWELKNWIDLKFMKRFQ